MKRLNEFHVCQHYYMSKFVQHICMFVFIHMYYVIWWSYFGTFCICQRCSLYMNIWSEIYPLVAIVVQVFWLFNLWVESSGFNGSIHPFSHPSIDCKSSLSAVMESSLSVIMEYSKWYSRVVSAFLTSDSANGHFSGGHKQFKIQLELKLNDLKSTLPISSSIDDYMLVFGQIKWFMGICLSTDIYTIHSCSSFLW